MAKESSFTKKPCEKGYLFETYGTGISFVALSVNLVMAFIVALTFVGTSGHGSGEGFIKMFILVGGFTTIIMLLIGVFNSRKQSLYIDKNTFASMQKQEIEEIYVENKIIQREPLDNFNQNKIPAPSPLWLGLGINGGIFYVSGHIGRLGSALGGDLRRMKMRSRAKREFSICVTYRGRRQRIFHHLTEAQAMPLFEALGQELFSEKKVTIDTSGFEPLGATRHKAYKFSLISTLILYIGWISITAFMESLPKDYFSPEYAARLQREAAQQEKETNARRLKEQKALAAERSKYSDKFGTELTVTVTPKDALIFRTSSANMNDCPKIFNDLDMQNIFLTEYWRRNPKQNELHYDAYLVGKYLKYGQQHFLVLKNGYQPKIITTNVRKGQQNQESVRLTKYTDKSARLFFCLRPEKPHHQYQITSIAFGKGDYHYKDWMKLSAGAHTIGLEIQDRTTGITYQQIIKTVLKEGENRIYELVPTENNNKYRKDIPKHYIRLLNMGIFAFNT